MITKAIILGKESNTNKYIIRLPLLETAASTDQFKIKATLCCDDGVVNPFNLNDVVYVAFEDSLYDKPVILGKLSKEGLLDNKTTAAASYVMNDLEVLGNAQLSKTSAIGDITYKDLYTLIQKASDTQAKLDSGYNDKDIGIYMTDHILRIYLYNFTEADIGKEIQLFRTTYRLSKGFKHPEAYGYGVVADKIKPKLELPLYPEVPEWMPNGGFIQTVWIITSEVISQGYIEINWPKDWVCLVIPRWNTLEEYYDWFETSSIFGTGASRGTVKIKFGLVSNGTLQFLSTGTLFLGASYSKPSGEDGYLLTYVEEEDNEYYILNASALYKSVK